VTQQGLLAFGGWNYDARRERGSKQPVLDHVLRMRLDGAEAAWETLELRLPHPRRAHAAATYEGKVHLVGGFDGSFQRVMETEVFDPATQQWSADPPPVDQRIAAS